MDPESSEAKRRRFRRANVTTWVGYRSARWARSTGALVVLMDGDEAGAANPRGRWLTVCDDHMETAAHRTVAEATRQASAPERWCDKCAFDLEWS